MDATAASMAAFAAARTVAPPASALSASGSTLLTAAKLLLGDLECRTIGAPALRAAMSATFSGSDSEGAWAWKIPYDACKAAQLLFMRKYARTMRERAASPSAFLAMLAKLGALMPSHTRRCEESPALQQFSTAIKLERLLITPRARFRRGTPMRPEHGILFTTYATLRSDTRDKNVSRMRQLVDWLGRDFDGVIVFDESHAMQNATSEKSDRGERAPTLMERHPRVRVAPDKAAA